MLYFSIYIFYLYHSILIYIYISFLLAATYKGVWENIGRKYILKDNLNYNYFSSKAKPPINLTVSLKGEHLWFFIHRSFSSQSSLSIKEKSFAALKKLIFHFIEARPTVIKSLNIYVPCAKIGV